MSYDYLTRKVGDYVSKKKSLDEEDISLAADEQRLGELTAIQSVLQDSDIGNKIAAVQRDFQNERDRIEGMKDDLNQEKEELVDEIGSEQGKIVQADQKLGRLSDNKYAVGSDKARDKCDEFIKQLDGLMDKLDEEGTGGGRIDYGRSSVSDFPLPPMSDTEPDTDKDRDREEPVPVPIPVSEPEPSFGSGSESLYGDGEFVPLLATNQETRTVFLDGKYVDVFDHPFEPNSYRVCNQGSAYPNGPRSTCGCCSSGTIINKAGGRTTEKEMVDYALRHGLCDKHGLTSPDSWVGLLDASGIETSNSTGTPLSDLAVKVEEGHGVIIGVSAALYNPEMYPNYIPGQGDGHALVLESVIRDHNTGDIIEYVVSDSNGRSRDDACHRVPARRLEMAYARLYSASVVTDEVIW